MRVKRGFKRRRRTRKWLKLAKGNSARRKNCWKPAKETVMRSLIYSYRDRRVRKREFRSLWIARINAAARMHGISYSRLMGGLKKKNIEVDRKILAEIAIVDPRAIASLVKAISS